MREDIIFKWDVTDRIKYCNSLKPGEKLVNAPPLKLTNICKKVYYPDHLEPQVEDYRGRGLYEWNRAWREFYRTPEYREWQREMTNNIFPNEEKKPCR